VTSVQSEIKPAVSRDLGDAELVVRAQRQDEDAFSMLVDRYRSRVRAKVVTILSDDDGAEDACQETFYRAYRDLPTLRRPHAFGSWLLTIATNVSKQQRQDRQGDILELLPDGYPDPRDDFSATELRTDLSSVIRELSPQMSALAQLHYLKNLDQEDIAKKLNLPLGTVSGTLARARRQLKSRIEHRQQRDAQRLRERVRFKTQGMLALYCPTCGRHRLQWRSSVLPCGSERMETFCPDCSAARSSPVTEWILPRRDGRVWDEETHLAAHRAVLLTARAVVRGCGVCPECAGRLLYLPSFVSGFAHHAAEQRIAWRCSECEYSAEGRLGGLVIGDPRVQRFWRENGLFLPPDGEDTAYGRSTRSRVLYLGITSRARLTVTVHRFSLELTAVDIEYGQASAMSS
jgi:RNA polymerase sigma-70 factor (ECF subfamily)